MNAPHLSPLISEDPAEMVEGCDYAVMEVSSHALELKRTDGIAFRCGVHKSQGSPGLS